MHITRKLANTSAITLILIFASITVITTVPVSAQLAAEQPTAGPLPSGATPSITIETIPYLSFSPNPIGVGQMLLVNMWLQPPINVARNLENAFQVTITKPDATKEVIGPMSSYQGDATAWFNYVPDQVGTYKLKFDFLGMSYPAGRYLAGVIVANNSGTNLNSAYYQPSATQEQELIVQQDMVLSWPPAPLPTDYWTRPVSVNNREWWPILGNYPATGYGPAIYTGGGPSWEELYPNTNPYWSSTYNFVPYVQAPSTSHVVWKRQGGIGGLIGGVFGDINLRANPGYPDIIYAGRCYDVVQKVYDGVTQSVWQCYDLRSGEIFWEKTDSDSFNINQAPTAITYTERTSQQVIGEEAMMRGLAVELLYIGSGRMIKYNPWNGAVTTNVSIDPLTTGTYYLHEYALSVQNLGGGNYRLINWTTNGNLATLTTSTNTRIISNISWPISSLPSTTDFNTGVAVYQTSINPSGTSGTGVSIGQRLIGINIKTGAVIWNVTAEDPGGHSQFFSTLDAVADNGVIINRMITGEIKAWDLYTGNVKWTTPLSYPWGSFGAYHVASAYGLYFCASYDGFHAINETNGNIEWTFHAYTPFQFETGYQTSVGSAEYVFHGGMQVADGKVYFYSMEHTQSQPTTRGLKMYCVNVFTGQQLWNFSGSEVGGGRSFSGAIADGYLAFGSQVDSMMYVFGKGKSSTTVTASDKTIAKGEPTMIEGKVLDMSPAQPGTPCVSADSMTTYMEYLHIQQPVDGPYHNFTVTGVPVMLLAIDEGGAVIEIGTTTSDSSGTFGMAWTPPSEGDYKITATFAGDDSYGSSWAETRLSVGPAAEPITIPEQVLPPDYTLTIVGTGIAVIIAVAIAAMLMLKKK